MPKSKLSAGLQDAFDDIEKRHGPDHIMRLGDRPAVKLDILPTGIASLDAALGVGGLVLGHPIEIYGPEGTGKTTLACHVVAEAQKRGGLCAYIDMEHSLDPPYAAAIGVDTDNLLLSQPPSAEAALDIADALCKSGEVKVIVLDSIAALVPRAEIEGDMGDSHMGLQARLMGQALRKMKPVLQQNGTMLFCINQLRTKMNVRFGSPETTPGGLALKYYARVRMDIRRIGAIKVKEEVIGAQTRIKIVKNAWAPPYRECEFEIIYGQGASREGALLDGAIALGIVKKSGAWFSYDGTKLGQGREAAKQTLADHPALAEEIARLVLAT